MPKCMRCMQDFGQEEFCPECGARKNRSVINMGQIPAGTILQNRYVIGDVLGQDGLGFTYVAWDALEERKDVVKEWYPVGMAVRSENLLDVQFQMEGDLKEGLKYQFAEQARKIQRMMGYPGLVEIYNVFQENQTVYYVMEYLKGQSIRKLLQRENPLEAGRAETIMMNVFRGLDRIHSSGLLHGNLTPENIFLSRDGTVKFLNFAWFSPELEAIRYSVFLGNYAPVQYYRFPAKIDADIDTYQAYAVYYRILAGEEPENANARQEEDHLAWISDYGIEVPKALEQRIMQEMGKKGKKNSKKSRREKDGEISFFQVASVPLMTVAIILGILLLI